MEGCTLATATPCIYISLRNPRKQGGGGESEGRGREGGYGRREGRWGGGGGGGVE